MDDLSKTRSLVEQMSVGVQRYLDKKTGVCKIAVEPRRPIDRSVLLSWEQKNSCFLPDDLKNFYYTTDGFLMTWCVKIESKLTDETAPTEEANIKPKTDGPIPVGRMHINSMARLMKIGGNNPTSMVNPSLADLDGDSDLEDENSGIEKPSFDSRCKIFELDGCDGYGKVCLVYKENKTDVLSKESEEIVARVYSSDFMTFDLNTSSESLDDDGGQDPKIEIWFLDRALRWHYITDSFTAYYRLMIMHLGLPQWQYAFTDIGLSQQAKQWFNLFAPLRLELDAELSVDPDQAAESNSSVTQIDISKVFKNKTDKKKPVPTQSQPTQSVRKKPTVASAKGQPQGIKTSGSSSQLSGKK